MAYYHVIGIRYCHGAPLLVVDRIVLVASSLNAGLMARNHMICKKCKVSSKSSYLEF